MRQMKRFLTGISKEDIGSSKYQQIMEAMKEYSEDYARRCLIIAADEADVIEYGGRGCHVDKNSILNIKLPEHE